MFTKNFNSLPDSLIEASKKIMTEASNEAPNIQRLTLTQTEEPVNEISVGLAQRAKAAATARLRNPNVQGAQASRAQRAYSMAARKVSGDVKIRATGNKPTTSPAN